jgi:hypothetical protein
MNPSCTSTTGIANATVARSSAFRSLRFIDMRMGLLITVAMLAAARDSSAQHASVMAQAIPVITTASPTIAGHRITEGYVTQPVVMAHASWGTLHGVGTLDLEGLTLRRGELNTGAYGEGYVDRRHPHTYVHELLAGWQPLDGPHGAASLFVGRGFAPFGSDDPMMRPFEKYPVNHHLAQVLERVVAVGAVRYRAVIGEFGIFNGDEPLSPGSAPKLDRFGDSWAGRLTAVPLDGVELSASLAHVASPEVRAGGGLDQRKRSVVARFARGDTRASRYAMVEWERTIDRNGGATVSTLTSALAEAAICRRGARLAARLERTDRPEEERLLDPFRTPRPPTDLSNLGESRWTTLTIDASAPAIPVHGVSAAPFVEVAAIGVAAGSPAGLFSPRRNYGGTRLWMLSAGARLRYGALHDRMGRYGAALAPTLSAMRDMPGMGGSDVVNTDLQIMKHEHAAVNASATCS